jgi:hypothetical protein
MASYIYYLAFIGSLNSKAVLTYFLEIFCQLLEKPSKLTPVLIWIQFQAVLKRGKIFFSSTGWQSIQIEIACWCLHFLIRFE